MRVKLILFFGLMASLYAKAQDVIYTTAGNKYTVKIVEIGVSEIRYKEMSNLEGPSYVISKQDVVLVEYQNGTAEVINSNPPDYSPNKQPIEAGTKKPEKPNANELYYMGQNFISINALALTNADITIMYDRDLLDNKLGVTAFGGYNFNTRTNIFNAFLHENYPNSKKKFDAGLGINYFVNNTGRSQYFVGILGKYTGLEYDRTTVTEEVINGFVFLKNKVERASASQFMIGVNNGVLVRVSPSFNFKIFASVGFANNNPVDNTSGSTFYNGYPKFYLGYCFGYRF